MLLAILTTRRMRSWWPPLAVGIAEVLGLTGLEHDGRAARHGRDGTGPDRCARRRRAERTPPSLPSAMTPMNITWGCHHVRQRGEPRDVGLDGHAEVLAEPHRDRVDRPGLDLGRLRRRVRGGDGDAIVEVGCRVVPLLGGRTGGSRSRTTGRRGRGGRDHRDRRGRARRRWRGRCGRRRGRAVDDDDCSTTWPTPAWSSASARRWRTGRGRSARARP